MSQAITLSATRLWRAYPREAVALGALGFAALVAANLASTICRRFGADMRSASAGSLETSHTSGCALDPTARVEVDLRSQAVTEKLEDPTQLGPVVADLVGKAPPLDERYGPTPPWHDAMAEIRGPAVAHVLDPFAERWDDPTSPVQGNPIAYVIDRFRHARLDPSPLVSHSISCCRRPLSAWRAAWSICCSSSLISSPAFCMTGPPLPK